MTTKRDPHRQRKSISLQEAGITEQNSGKNGEIFYSLKEAQMVAALKVQRADEKYHDKQGHPLWIDKQKLI